MGRQSPTLKKVRIHECTVGVLYLTSVLLARNVDMRFLHLAVAVAGLQVLSLVTCFCPVYFVLNRLTPGGERIQDGPGS